MFKRFAKQYKSQRYRIYRLTKEFCWIAVGQVASVVGALVLVRVLTEYLEPSQYGALTLALTLSTLISQAVMGGIVAGIGRFYSVGVEKGDLWSYLGASGRLLSYATLVVVVIAIFVVSGLIVVGQSQWIWLAISVLLYSILFGYNSALNSLQNAARQRAVAALHSGMDAWLKIGFVICIIAWLGAKNTLILVGYTFSLLIVSISQLIFLHRLINSQQLRQGVAKSKNWTKEIWKFSWPFSIFGIFTWIQQSSDRWALEAFTSTQEVGQYAVLFQLGYTSVLTTTSLLMTLIAPILYQISGTATDHKRNASVRNISWRVTQVGLFLTTCAFLLTYFLHNWLFRWLVAEAFRDVSKYLPWVVLASGLFAVGQILSLKVMSDLRSKALLKVKIGTAFVGTTANMLGAWLYGLDGVVFALALFSVVYMIWMILLVFEQSLRFDI